MAVGCLVGNYQISLSLIKRPFWKNADIENSSFFYMYENIRPFRLVIVQNDYAEF